MHDAIVLCNVPKWYRVICLESLMLSLMNLWKLGVVEIYKVKDCAPTLGAKREYKSQQEVKTAWLLLKYYLFRVI